MNTVQAGMDYQARREAFALAIVQGYVSRNSMPGVQNREQFLDGVWELADQLIAAASKPKTKP
jgi:hypothetical protein